MELERIYTGDDARVGMVLEAVRRLVDDPLSMRAFVSLEVGDDHAVTLGERGEQGSERLAGHQPSVQQDQLPAGGVDLVVEVDAVDFGTYRQHSHLSSLVVCLLALHV